MNEFIQHFHFIRPWAFLCLVPLAWFIWQLKKIRLSQSGWSQLLPKHIAKELLTEQKISQGFSLSLPAFIGVLLITALAGPSWHKLPQPVYEVKRGSVILMDMSYSMFSTDLTPNRQTRARFKAIDLLETLNEGDIGLIAYAGDAFKISPLTQDINNIKLLLPALTPDIMPEPGSNPLAGLELANSMLTNAGHISGDIYWFTDGVEQEDVNDIQDWLAQHNHRLNILGVGTSSGAPIKMTNGELLKDHTGSIVIPRLNPAVLKGISQKSNGNYQTISHSNSDIEQLITDISLEQSRAEENLEQSMHFGDQWQEAGPFLVLAILPLLLGYFRRGVLLSFLPLVLLSTPEPAYAGIWQDLWKTSDQQAAEKFTAQDYQGAAQQFNDPLWQGSSHYKAGNYEQALQSFKQVDSIESKYNQANALAKLNQLDDAIKAYDEVLKQQPEHQDAKTNKALLEQLKQQQDQQNNEQDQDQQNSEQNNEQQDKQQGEQSEGSEQEQDQNSESNNSEQRDEQDSESQNSEQDSAQSQEQQDSKSENSSDTSESPEPKEQEEQTQASAQEEQTEQESSEQEQMAQQAQASNEPLTEEEQKHAQMLKKVTDDPYLLLRNKMQYEYQKRQQQGRSKGVIKSW